FIAINEREKLGAIAGEQRRGGNIQRNGPAGREGRQDRLKVTVAASLQYDYLSPEERRPKCNTLRRLACDGKPGVGQNCERTCLRDHIVKVIERFPNECAGIVADAGDVALRPVQTGDQAGTHGLAAEYSDDRYC